MKKDFFKLLSLIVVLLLIVSGVIYVGIKKIDRSLTFDNKAASEAFGVLTDLRTSITNVVFIISNAYASSSQSDVEMASEPLGKALAQLEEKLKEVNAKNLQSVLTQQISVKNEDGQEVTTDSSAILKDVNELLPLFLEQAQGALKLRLKALNLQSELRSARKDLSKEYRALKEIPKLSQDEFKSGFDRSVVTILSSDSPKDLAFVGRSIWRDIEEKYPTVLKSAQKAEFEKLLPIYKKAWEVAVEAYSTGEDYNIFMSTTSKFASKVSLLEGASKDLLGNSQVDMVNLLKMTQGLTLGSVAVALVAALFVAFLILRKIQGRISKSTGEISTAISDLIGISDNVTEISDGLSQATQSQASAVDETMSAVTEINAMANNNKSSSELALKSTDVALSLTTEGVGIIENLREASDSVHERITELERVFQVALSKFAQILAIINEIDSKTRVISDIVFQTKLLSFNASVEAERAGEHGKGFSVVSQEIGSLATLSGTSNEEIKALLQKSLADVAAISSEVDRSVKASIANCSKDGVRGRTLAQQASDIMVKIQTSAQQVAETVRSIEQASGEQASGLDEINKAINQISQLTSSNSVRSQQGKSASVQLTEQVKAVESALEDVLDYVGQSSAVRIDNPTQHPHQEPAAVSS